MGSRFILGLFVKVQAQQQVVAELSQAGYFSPIAYHQPTVTAVYLATISRIKTHLKFDA